jgi:pyruvate dehydrogenase E1 component
VQLLGSGTILREVIAAAELLQSTGASQPMSGLHLRSLCWRAMVRMPNAGIWCIRLKRTFAIHTQCLKDTTGPIVVSTDYMRTFAEQVRAFIPKDRSYKVLGTDGFGRSDSRAKLREFFEVNRYFVVIAALKSLADEGALSASVVAQAIAKYGINQTNQIR